MTDHVEETVSVSRVEAEFSTVWLARNWPAFILRGVLALLFAIFAFVVPSGSLLALTIVFGAFTFANGLFSVYAAVRNTPAKDRFLWLLLSGILCIGIGVIVVVAPLVATVVLATFFWTIVAFWSVATGSLELAAAIRLRKAITGEIWLALSGIVSIIFGIAVAWLVVVQPEAALLALGWIIGFYALVFGVIMIALGLRLRKLAKSQSEGTSSFAEAT
ncbi:HdeD family acid-resistance protein [Parvularcula lutaonensis]|uniref:HdeD family acid-resistance protein n=1 Tax=Parvularcula lutaonensis TaxID=491923 RepID=A0ABV7MAX2_9PROT|nr:DUF308 domain-containing protein [Parvularcula lutaonensis]GGY38339.1 hypothetical protein GCM10007148_03310 [Parvularcula lutaonensis]